MLGSSTNFHALHLTIGCFFSSSSFHAHLLGLESIISPSYIHSLSAPGLVQYLCRAKRQWVLDLWFPGGGWGIVKVPGDIVTPGKQSASSPDLLSAHTHIHLQRFGDIWIWDFGLGSIAKENQKDGAGEWIFTSLSAASLGGTPINNKRKGHNQDRNALLLKS